MYKKLFIAPLALTLALSAVSPNFAYAEEGVTEETKSNDLLEKEVSQKLNYQVYYDGKVSDYG